MTSETVLKNLAFRFSTVFVILEIRRKNKQGEGIRPVPFMLLGGHVSSVSAQTLPTTKSQTEGTVGPKKTSDLLEMVKYSFLLSCYRFTTCGYFAHMNKSRIRTVAIYCVSARQNSLINHQGMLKRTGKWLPRVLGRIFPPERWKSEGGVPLHSSVNKQLPGKKLTKHSHHGRAGS